MENLNVFIYCSNIILMLNYLNVLLLKLSMQYGNNIQDKTFHKLLNVETDGNLRDL